MAIAGLGHTKDLPRGRLRKQEGDARIEGGLVLLHDDQVLPLCVQDLLADRALAVQRIAGHQPPGQGEGGQQRLTMSASGKGKIARSATTPGKDDQDLGPGLFLTLTLPSASIGPLGKRKSQAATSLAV